ncbi:MAG TPA: VCBS repeat-containing protein, partial [Methylomirabilota bacterium]|nr:VCBS repeat-containing protein [Methylomirabilota bacterium]
MIRGHNSRQVLGLLQALQLWIREFPCAQGQPNAKRRFPPQSQSLRLHVLIITLLATITCGSAAQLERIRQNNPGLVVDLGVGLWAWPMPMDWDGDGDLDLLVACPDKPYNGVYFFENPAGKGVKLPIFKPARRLGAATADMTLSMVNGQPRMMAGRNELPKFRDGDWSTRKPWFPSVTVVPIKHPRDHFWRWADFDGDGRSDLIAGHGDWTEFGWFDKNEWWKGYNWQGVWTGSPVRGRVFWLRNEGSDSEAKLSEPKPILADGKPVDVYGRPGQMLADFDGDGDLDLMCGEFLDGFTYFQNIGTRTEPRYASGQRLVSADKQIVVDLEMLVPHAIDWDGDGDVDMIVGDEDGRVALFEHKGQLVDGMPQFSPPKYFQQEADELKFGALVTPCGFDWDGDGDLDFIAGNTAGYISFIENLSGAGVARPKFSAPQLLKANGETIRIMAGPNGSIQGPLEAKWGYTTQTVADWDGDGLPDIIANSIFGKVIW